MPRGAAFQALVKTEPFLSGQWTVTKQSSSNNGGVLTHSSHHAAMTGC